MFAQRTLSIHSGSITYLQLTSVEIPRKRCLQVSQILLSQHAVLNALSRNCLQEVQRSLSGTFSSSSVLVLVNRRLQAVEKVTNLTVSSRGFPGSIAACAILFGEDAASCCKARSPSQFRIDFGYIGMRKDARMLRRDQ